MSVHGLGFASGCGSRHSRGTVWRRSACKRNATAGILGNLAYATICSAVQSKAATLVLVETMVIVGTDGRMDGCGVSLRQQSRPRLARFSDIP